MANTPGPMVLNAPVRLCLCTAPLDPALPFKNCEPCRIRMRAKQAAKHARRAAARAHSAQPGPSTEPAADLPSVGAPSGGGGGGGGGGSGGNSAPEAQKRPRFCRGCAAPLDPALGFKNCAACRAKMRAHEARKLARATQRAREALEEEAGTSKGKSEQSLITVGKRKVR
jgi:hypothetical protein